MGTRAGVPKASAEVVEETLAASVTQFLKHLSGPRGAALGVICIFIRACCLVTARRRLGLGH